ERDVRHVKKVVREVLLDDVALVAKADDELRQPVGGVDLHDVPEDRLAPDLDHRLRLEVGLLADAGAEAASENHDFHGVRLNMLSSLSVRRPSRGSCSLYKVGG